MGEDGFLRGLPWLQGLDEVEWQRLLAGATRHRFDAGTTVFAPSREPRSVYLLECGRIRIYRLSTAGDVATLGYVAPGEVFGELTGFGDYARESYAEAQVDSYAWKIPSRLFRALLEGSPTRVIEVTRQIGVRMKRVESRVESFVFHNVHARLAHTLLELAEDGGRRDGDRWILDQRVSQGELATLIGSTRQSVNGAMTRMKADGLLAKHDGRIVLLRPDKLRRAAEGGGAAEAPGGPPGPPADHGSRR